MNAGTFFFLLFTFLSPVPRIVLAHSRHVTYFLNITVYEETFGKNTQLFCEEFRKFKENIFSLLLLLVTLGTYGATVPAI